MKQLDLNIPQYALHLPWFMFDLSNMQLITSATIPNTDIKDSKNIVLTETPIPGLNFSPVTPGGTGNRKISFTLPLLKRNNTVGNVLLLKQFDMLRNNAVGLTGIFSQQFNTTPKVLFNYGVGSIPLVYWVAKCDFNHKQGMTNALGSPQYTEIEFELILDETNPLYIGEEVFRKVSSLLGMAEGAYDTIVSIRGGKSY
jgi:hypothetical protein